MTEGRDQRKRNHPSHEWGYPPGAVIECCLKCGTQWDETPESEQPCRYASVKATPITVTVV